MQIDPYVRDLVEYRANVAKALDDKDSRFYLDTSTLMWAVGLSRPARKSFLDWCAAKTTFVPVWAAHEFQRHLISGTARKNISSVVGSLVSSHREFARLAAEQADDALCLSKGFSDRSGYIAEVQRVLARINELKGVVDADENRVKAGAQEVIAFVNQRLLRSDLDPILAELGVSGEMRLTHRVPPGFKDDSKPENVLGDVVIWREILKDVELHCKPPEGLLSRFRRTRAGVVSAAILISRDEKPDWLSSAHVLKQDGATLHTPPREFEQDVALPHPLLGHELERCGAGQFFLVNPSWLSGLVEEVDRKHGVACSVSAWRAASARPEVIETIRKNVDAEEQRLIAKAHAESRTRAAAAPNPLPPPAAGNKAAPTSELAAAAEPQVPSGPSAPLQAPAPSPAASAVVTGELTQSLEAIMRAPVTGDAATFLDGDTAKRASLLAGWQADALAGSMQATRLGRIICEIAKASAGGYGVEQLPATLEEFRRIDAAFAQVVLLGALCATYFDADAELLKCPRRRLAGVLLLLEDESWAVGAFDRVRTFLQEANANLVYFPGSKTKVIVEISLTPASRGQVAVLKELRLKGAEVLIDSLPKDHPCSLSILSAQPNLQQCDAQSLLGVLAVQYAIPLRRMECATPGTKHVGWRMNMGLYPLDTDAPLGIGGLGEDE